MDPVEAADSDTDQGTEVETYDESVQNGISLVSRSQCYSSSEPADPITTQLGVFFYEIIIKVNAVVILSYRVSKETTVGE